MAREYAFPTVATYSAGVEVTDAWQTLLTNGDFVPPDYPENLFWGGIGSDYHSGGALVNVRYIYDDDTSTATIRMEKCEQENQSYCYISNSDNSVNGNVWAYSTNYSFHDVNWNGIKSDFSDVTQSDFVALNAENGTNTRFINAIRKNYCCIIPRLFILNLTQFRNSYFGSSYPITTMTITEFYNAIQNNPDTEYCCVGFDVQYVRYFDYNNLQYGGRNTNYKKILNVLYSGTQTAGQYSISRHFTFGVGLGNRDLTKIIQPTAPTAGYYSYADSLYTSSDNVLWDGVIIPCYMGDEDFDFTPYLNYSASSNGYFYFGETSNYIVGGFTTGSTSLRVLHVNVLPRLNYTETIRFIASFGMPFSDISDTNVYAFTSEHIYFPVLDKNNVYHGEYTHGAENSDNPFSDNINESKYVPGGSNVRPEPVDPGDDETGGDDYEPNNPAGLGSGFGFVTQYAIRAAHLTDLGSKLWEGFFSEDEPGGIFQYMNNFIFAVNTDTGSVNFSDIMNFFISLRAYPCPISAMASTSAGGQDLYVGSGSKPIHLNTTFSIVNDLIGNIDAGERSVPYWFGDYRDFSLECIIYLPYCGTIQLNPGDIMGGTLSVNYTVDFCSGACVAYVLCTTWEGKLLRVGSLQGQLGADVPMTATNAGQVAARMYGDRIDAAETFTGALKSVISGGTSVAGGNYGGAVSAGFGAFIDPALQQERLRANIGSRGAIAAPMLSAGRGLSGFADSQTVFLQIRSPIYAEPDNYDNVVGMPSTSAVRIGDCSGFCQFINVDVSGITTDLDDQQTIRRALESGIII